LGIIHKIKRRLPIVGAGGSAPTTRPTPSAPPESTASQAAPAEPKTQMVSETEAVRDGSGQSVRDFIEELVKSNNIVLFMKGSPLSPSCGFSANAAGILSSYGEPIAHFDVLSDPEVRQGVKDFSDWPTIPQIYVGGEFLGGSDILMQMHDSGELKKVISTSS